MSMNERSLREMVRKGNKFHPEHIHSFQALIIGKMRNPQRIAAIRYVTAHNIDKLAGEWYGQRITFTPQGECRYVAGQDYPGEIVRIREDIIKKVSNNELR